MSWAAQRRFLILTILASIGVAMSTLLFIVVFYKTPSCADGVQNQDEMGVDCGGSCAYLCLSQIQPPTVLFTRAIATSSGRTDFIARVENKNAAAAKNVPYTISYTIVGDTTQKTVSGFIDIPPVTTTSIYLPGVVTGGKKVVRPFLNLAQEDSKWYALATDPRILPLVSNTVLGTATSTPRIDVSLTNQSVIDLKEVPLFVFVRDSAGEILSASQTVASFIPAQGTASATFTWNEPFPGIPSVIEVLPVVPLP